ncbi:MAG: hypothetical protein RIK87_14685 [Fuerstiella sp.]
MFPFQVSALSGLGLLLAIIATATPCLSQDSEVSLIFRLDSASPSARKWWHNHLDCTFHSYWERASRADCVILLSRSRDADQRPDQRDYKVDHLLKSTDDAVVVVGQRLRMPVPADADNPRSRLLVFCAVENGSLRELQSVEVSAATVSLLRVVAHRPLEEQVPHLFRFESSDDQQASEFAFAELQRIPTSAYGEFRNLLPAETIRQRCFQASTPKHPMHLELFLRLLPLVAGAEEVMRIETLLFGNDACLDRHCLQLIGPYLALASERQASRLYRELFLVHHRKTVERNANSPEAQEHFRVAYAAYTGLRIHQNRREIVEYFHRAAADIVHHESGLCDLVLSDYRQLGDWRVLEDAARLARNTEIHEAYSRAGLMYLMSAQRDGQRRHAPNLYKGAETHLSRVEEERSQFVAETRKIWQVFDSESEAVPKQ